MKTSKRELERLADELDADLIATNIYDYENKLHDKWTKTIAFSRGNYGVTGRLDYIVNENKFVYF